MEISPQQIAHLRMLKSGIIRPFETIEDCVSNLFGIQSQAQQFGEISIFNRTKSFDYEELIRLYQYHKIIKIWGQRMTVHMFSVKDWKIVHQIYSERDNFVKKAWQENQELFNTLLVKVDALTQVGIVDKKQLTALIADFAPHIDSPYRDYSVILQASLNGLIFGVPHSPQTKHYAHRSRCISQEEYASWSQDRQSALDYLLMNYFQNYGPATLADFCHWSGLRKRESQIAFNRIIEKLVGFSYGGKTFYLPSDDIQLVENERPEKFVKLLGKFDPLFVSFADKSWIATLPQQKSIWRPAAHIEAVLLVNEKLMGTWRYSIKGKKIDFTFYLFHSITKKTEHLIADEAAKIAGFLAKTLNKISYE